MIFAAYAAGIMPLGFVDSVAGFGDWEKFRAMVRRSRDFGFLGAGCIHPGQVTIVNDEYTPTAEEVEYAKKVIAMDKEAAAAEVRAAQALAKECGPEGLHVGHVVVDGGIDGEILRNRFPDFAAAAGERLIDLDGLAEAYWFLHQQAPRAWTFELDLRSKLESW
jgi:hypothetical protein